MPIVQPPSYADPVRTPAWDALEPVLAWTREDMPIVQPAKDPARAELEARMAELEKKVASVASPAPQRKAKRGRVSTKKTRIRRRTAQDLDNIHSNGTSCNQLIQNTDAAFTAYGPSTCNDYRWNGAAHVAYLNTSACPGVPTRNKFVGKLGINKAGRLCINGARSVLAWASEKEVKDLLHQLLRQATSYFSGGD